MALYRTQPRIEGEPSNPLSLLIEHLAVWGPTMTSASYEDGGYIVSIEPALTEDQILHLGMTAL